MVEQKLVWVAHYWLQPFLGEEQDYYERFDKREQAREFLRKVRKNPRFLKAEEPKQVSYKHLDPL